MERYLTVIQNSEMRGYVVKFRISTHKFQIETGRYVKSYMTLCEGGIRLYVKSQGPFQMSFKLKLWSFVSSSCLLE